MRSLYNKVFKNTQVTYGRPFHVIPCTIKVAEEQDDPEDDGLEKELPPDPEEILNKATRESELIIREAELESGRILEEARQEAEKRAEILMEEARQKGYADGLEAANKQTEETLAEARQIQQSASQEHDSILLGMETEVIGLVLDVARRAVAGELATNREVILQLVSEALSNCSNKNGAIIKVSPDDYEYLMDNRERLSTLADGADGAEIKRDGTMKPGDCIVETPLGSVDASVQTRLDKIEDAFREQFEGR